MKKLFFAAAFAGMLLSTQSATAEAVIPLHPDIRTVLFNKGINPEGVVLNEEQQAEFLRLFVSAHAQRPTVEAFLRNAEHERIQEVSTAPSLRSLLSGGEPEPQTRQLTAREQRHVIRTLRRVGFTDINMNTLTTDQQMRLLNLSRNTFIKLREVRRILNDG